MFDQVFDLNVCSCSANAVHVQPWFLDIYLEQHAMEDTGLVFDVTDEHGTVLAPLIVLSHVVRVGSKVHVYIRDP